MRTAALRGSLAESGSAASTQVWCRSGHPHAVLERFDLLGVGQAEEFRLRLRISRGGALRASVDRVACHTRTLPAIPAVEEECVSASSLTAELESKRLISCRTGMIRVVGQANRRLLPSKAQSHWTG